MMTATKSEVQPTKRAVSGVQTKHEMSAACESWKKRTPTLYLSFRLSHFFFSCWAVITRWMPISFLMALQEIKELSQRRGTDQRDPERGSESTLTSILSAQSSSVRWRCRRWWHVAVSSVGCLCLSLWQHIYHHHQSCVSFWQTSVSLTKQQPQDQNEFTLSE